MSKEAVIGGILGGVGESFGIQHLVKKEKKKKRRSKIKHIKAVDDATAITLSSGRSLISGNTGGSLLGGRPGGATGGSILGG